MKIYKLTLIALFGMILIILIGTLGFQYYEGLSFFDALWMTTITVLTVGYGDFTPETFYGRVFALIIIPFGISLAAYALGTITASIIEGKYSKTVGRKRMERAISKLENHIIVCGLGRVGLQVVAQLQKEKANFVIVERDEELIGKFADDMFYIEGDATEDEVLFKAGIQRAKGVISTLPQDADNVLIAITAKGINKNILVIARAERIESEDKLRRAGADKIINPSSIGGRRMAMSILKPISIDYVDTIMHANDVAYNIEEIKIQGDSKVTGRSLKDTKLREEYGLTVVAIKRDQKIISNPKAEEKILLGDTLLVFGMTDNLHRFEEIAKE